MINMYEVSETNKMIEHENLDVRTITLGISLLDCIDSDLGELNRKIYEKITMTARDLVATGQEIEKEFGAFLVYRQEVVVKIVFEERSRVVVGFECADMLVYPVLGIVRPYVAYASAASGASLDRYAHKHRPVA